MVMGECPRIDRIDRIDRIVASFECACESHECVITRPDSAPEHVLSLSVVILENREQSHMVIPDKL